MKKIVGAIGLSLFLIGNCFALSSTGEGRLVVSAAASLKDAFLEVGKTFERTHSGSKVSFNFAGSNQLATQIEQGAPVDVFASADMTYIARLANKNLTSENTVLAKNKLVMIVSKISRIRIDSLLDIGGNGVRLIAAAKQVPCAIYARQMLTGIDRAGLYGADFSSRVLANTVSEELDVRMIVMKIAMGEGDVGFVYASDVTGDVKNKVKVIAIPDQLNVVAEYGIAIVKNSSNPGAAKEFYNFVRSAEGQAILGRSGLLPAQAK